MRADAQPKVLVFDAAAQRAQRVLDTLQAHGLSAERVDLSAQRSDPLPHGADVAMFVFDTQATMLDRRRLDELVQRLQADNVPTLLWGEPGAVPLPAGGNIDRVAGTASLDEVIGRLETIARYVPMVRRLDRELSHLQRLSRQLNRYFEDIDKEMRLAGRLQQDFLPRRAPDVAPLRFAHLFRPAGWVSGDIFDVFRIDDEHVALFIADAMGHGTAAGLMTMFIRRALVAQRVVAGRYEIVAPPEAMRDLHDELARLELPHFQFITSAYAVVNTRTLELRVARGGHPYPIHVGPDAHMTELQPEGGLLGLADLTPDFEEHRLTLQPGDKLIFYTDGLEEVLVGERKRCGALPLFTAELRQWVRSDAQQLVDAIAAHLDRREGSLNPEDDVTVVVMEVAR